MMMTIAKKVTKTIILLGDFETGKSKILQRYLKKRYDDHYLQTYGVNFSSKDIKISDTKKNIEYDLTLCLWDCGGDELESKYLPANVYKNANGFFILSSYDSLSSLKNIHKWLIHIKQNSALKYPGLISKWDIPIFIVLNKYDIPDKDKAFTREDIEGIVGEIVNINGDMNIKIYDKISAKGDMDIDYIFDRVIHILTGCYTKNYITNFLSKAKSYRHEKSEKEKNERERADGESLHGRAYTKTFVLTSDTSTVVSVAVTRDARCDKSCCS